MDLQRNRTRRAAFALSATISCLTATSQARADEACRSAFEHGAFACVLKILEPLSDTGAWDTAPGPSYHVSIDGPNQDPKTPISEGAGLSRGERIRTRRARVEIQLRDGGVARLADDTALSVGDVFEQWTGNVWYILRSRTTIRYGAVTAAIKGTSFFVRSTGGGASIAVNEGVVVVGVSESEPLVTEHHQVELAAHQQVDVDGGVLGQPRDWSEEEQYDLSRRMWQAGHPTLVMGLSAGIGTEGKFFAPQFRASALYRFPGRIGLSADTSVTPWGENGFRVVLGGGPRYFLAKLPPADHLEWNQLVVHHASLGADLISVVSPNAANSHRPQWGGAACYDFAFPRRRVALLVQARLGVLEGPVIFWNFSYGIGIAL